MRLMTLGGLFFLALTLVPVGAAEDNNSYIGFWELTFDEDGTPKDTMEFRRDGKYISHGWACRTADIVPYHLHNGDLYATIIVPSKGPISIVFRHNKDGRLSFTSPRTRNNAYYTKLEENPCPKGK